MTIVSDKPWGRFTAADYSPQQWRRATLVHLEPGKGQDPMAKDLHKVPVREPDGTLNRNGVHTAAGGHGIGAVQGLGDAQRKEVAKQLVDLYENELKEEPPASLGSMAGVNEVEDQREDAAERSKVRSWYDRSFPLEGIEILTRAKGGDGRTVEAYASVFDVPTEIHDEHGHYNERIHRSAFNMTINSGAAAHALCLYNHGMSVVDGRPDSLAQVPLGTPLEIRPDGRGLRTLTRYNKSALAESVLESIKNDDITAQSFRGRIFRSDPQQVPRVRRGQPLPTVTRMELGLTDYGPTPRPYYEGASIVAVRSVRQIASDLAGLDETERAELIRMLSTTRRPGPESVPATDILSAGTEEPREHSGRMRILRLRAEAIFAGVGNGT